MEYDIKTRKKRFLEVYKKKGCNTTEACKAAGISRKTFYNWMKKKSFSVAVKDAESSLFDWVESQMIKKMQGGDSRMLIHFSKTKMKHRGYVEKSEVVHEGSVPLTVIIEEAKPEEKS